MHRKIWQVQEISGKGWNRTVLCGQTRYIPAYTRKEALCFYEHVYKKYTSTTLSGVVIDQSTHSWELAPFLYKGNLMDTAENKTSIVMIELVKESVCIGIYDGQIPITIQIFTEWENISPLQAGEIVGKIVKKEISTETLAAMECREVTLPPDLLQRI